MRPPRRRGDRSSALVPFLGRADLRFLSCRRSRRLPASRHDCRSLRENGQLEKPLGRALREALTKEELGLPFALLGVEAAVDVDAVRLAFSPGDHGRPLVLLRGRFDRAHFSTGPGKLEELKLNGFRLYRHENEGRDLTLALAGDTLVVCLSRARVVAALLHAAGKGATPLDNQRLKGILDKLDRKRAIWLAADLVKLGAPPLEFEAVLRPVFAETDALSGGVTSEAEARVEIDFAARTEANAARLEEHLKAVVKVAAGGAVFMLDENKKSLLQLFASAEITRRGTEIRLRSRQ